MNKPGLTVVGAGAFMVLSIQFISTNAMSVLAEWDIATAMPAVEDLKNIVTFQSVTGC